MKKTHILMILALAVLFLAGCKGGGSASSGSSQYYAYNDGVSTGGDIVSGGSYYTPADTSGGGFINPEPATIALFGSGLVGLASYAMAKFRRKK